MPFRLVRRPGRPHRRRRVHLVAAPAVLLGAVAVLAPAPAASAHDDLVGSTPGAGSVVAQAPSTVELQFAGAPVSASVQLLDGCGRPVTSTTSVDGPTVRAEIVASRATDVRGRWTVSWVTIGGDGHEVDGETTFAVEGTPDCSTGSAADTLEVAAVERSAGAGLADTEPVGAAAEPTATEPTETVAVATEPTATSATSAGSTLPTAPLLAGGVVLLAGAGGVVGARLRRRPGAGS